MKMASQKIILPIITNLSTDYRCYKIANSLKTRGYRPIILCDKPLTRLGDKWNAFEIKVITRKSHVESFARVMLVFNLKLIPWLLFDKARYWIVEDCPPLFTCAFFGKIMGRKVFYDSHELFTESATVNRSLLRKVFWRAWHDLGILLIRRIITVSPDYIRHLKSRFPSKAYYLLPNVPHRQVRPISAKKTPKNSYKLIYQGYLRNHTHLINCLRAIGRKPELSLTIIGEGEKKKAYREYVKAHGLEDRITFLNTVSFQVLADMTPDADIGVCLLNPLNKSIDYTMANKIFEYCHAGLPVLMSNTKGCREILKSHKIGVVVNPNSPDKILEGISQLTANYENYRANCLQAKQYYTWENYEKGLFDFISSA